MSAEGPESRKVLSGEPVELTAEHIRWCDKLCELAGMPDAFVQVLFHPTDPEEPVLYLLKEDEDGETLVMAGVYPDDPGGMYIPGKQLPVRRPLPKPCDN